MSPDRKVNITFSLDEDGFLPRKCPVCEENFSVEVEQESDDIEPQPDKTDEVSSNDMYCPYCGYCTDSSDFLTRDQHDKIEAIGHNYMAELVNEQLFKPMKSMASKSNFFEFKSDDIKSREIPETIEDGTIISRRIYLECCEEEVKVRETHEVDFVYCTNCGTRNINKEVSP